MPSIGSLAVFSIEGDLQPAASKVTPFAQFGANGMGFILGAKRQPVSKLVSTSFSATRATQDALKKAAAALVGTVVTVTRDQGGSPETVADCVVQGYSITKSDSGAGLPGGAAFVTIIEWEIVVPYNW